MLPKSFKLLLAFFALLFIVGILIFRPVPMISEEDALVTSGQVVKVWETKGKDLILQIDGDHRRFYVNRGSERGLSVSQLEQLIGQSVTFKYPDYWTPLDWDRESIHLSKIESEGVVIFTELEG